MLKHNNLASLIAFFWAFLYESAGTPYFGFYLLPAALMLILYFYSPLVSREINVFLVFWGGIFSLSAINLSWLFFTAPFFLILSFILYVFAKK
ncbi:MAG: hypothetical protein AAB522_02740 [Patescibacteria group bacterium]